jgi:hypothetical protein
MTEFIGTSITIIVNYNSLQSMTVYDSLHSLLDYEHILFCVTYMVLIYELATSLASVVHWLAFHSWTLNFSPVDYDDFLTNEFMFLAFSRVLTFITLGELNRDYHFKQLKLLHAYPLLQEPCVNSVAMLRFHYSVFQAVFTEPLPSKWSYSSHCSLLKDVRPE